MSEAPRLGVRKAMPHEKNHHENHETMVFSNHFLANERFLSRDYSQNEKVLIYLLSQEGSKTTPRKMNIALVVGSLWGQKAFWQVPC